MRLASATICCADPADSTPCALPSTGCVDAREVLAALSALRVSERLRLQQQGWIVATAGASTGVPRSRLKGRRPCSPPVCRRLRRRPLKHPLRCQRCRTWGGDGRTWGGDGLLLLLLSRGPVVLFARPLGLLTRLLGLLPAVRPRHGLGCLPYNPPCRPGSPAEATLSMPSACLQANSGSPAAAAAAASALPCGRWLARLATSRLLPLRWLAPPLRASAALGAPPWWRCALATACACCACSAWISVCMRSKLSPSNIESSVMRSRRIASACRSCSDVPVEPPAPPCSSCCSGSSSHCAPPLWLLRLLSSLTDLMTLAGAAFLANFLAFFACALAASSAFFVAASAQRRVG
jgi:hypothetical protein